MKLETQISTEDNEIFLTTKIIAQYYNTKSTLEENSISYLRLSAATISFSANNICVHYIL